MLIRKRAPSTFASLPRKRKVPDFSLKDGLGGQEGTEGTHWRRLIRSAAHEERRAIHIANIGDIKRELQNIRSEVVQPPAAKYNCEVMFRTKES